MRIIQIVGMPRSGTTALANWFSTHNQIQAIPETHYLNTKKINGDIRGLPRGLTNEDMLRRLLLNKDYLGYRDFLESYVEALNINAEVIVESTPSHLMHIDRLVDEVDCVIIIYRNCMEVCSSLKNVFWGKKGTAYNAKRWLKYQRITRRINGNEKILKINYYSFCKRDMVFQSFVNKVAEQLSCKLEKRDVSDGTLFLDSLDLEPWKKDSVQLLDGYKPKRHNNLSFSEIGICFIYELINIIEESFQMWTGKIYRGRR